jgi:hypothetical protein
MICLFEINFFFCIFLHACNFVLRWVTGNSERAQFFLNIFIAFDASKPPRFTTKQTILQIAEQNVQGTIFWGVQVLIYVFVCGFDVHSSNMSGGRFAFVWQIYKQPKTFVYQHQTQIV